MKNPLKCLNCGSVFYMGVGSKFTLCPVCRKPWKGIVTPYPVTKKTKKTKKKGNPITAKLVRLYKPIMATCSICNKAIASWEKYYIYDPSNGRFYHLKCFQKSRKNPTKPQSYCPKCGSHDIKYKIYDGYRYYICYNCKHEWKGKYSIYNPTLRIPITSRGQLQHLFQAQTELSKAGVTFDTGSNIQSGETSTRDWELDWSLKGATVRNPRRLMSPSRKIGGEWYETLQQAPVARGLAESMAHSLRSQGVKVRIIPASIKGYYYIFVRGYTGEMVSNPKTGYKVKCPKCGSYDTDSWKKSNQRYYICYKCHHEWKGRYGIDNPTSKLFRNFHGTDPVKTSKVLFEPPKAGEPLIKIGRLSQINYVPESPSHKAGHEFYHKSGDLGHKTIKSNAILATNQQGTQLFIVREKDSRYPLFTGRGIIG